MYGSINVRGARENNLNNISLDIPKRKITVFTGVSGSGKSSLVFSTIAAESQRLLNETYTAFIQGFLPHYGQPDVDSLQNLSATIIIDQKRMGGNARSTVGTVTDMYTLLRLLYARLGLPHIGYTSAFSFNDPQGMCPDCEGLGQVSVIDINALIDREKSLNEGAIQFPTFAVGSWFWNIFAQSGFFDLDKKLRDYSTDEWKKLVNGTDARIKLSSVGGTVNSTYEGLVPKFKRLYFSKDMDPMISICEACAGKRFTNEVLAYTLRGKSISDVLEMTIVEAKHFFSNPSLTKMLTALDDVGLGYITLWQPLSTLSGGERQRLKLAIELGNTSQVYVLDEPTTGLHMNDVDNLITLLNRIVDNGCTVIVIEHNLDVIARADWIIDLGPGAGHNGGQIIFEGTATQLVGNMHSLTGQYLRDSTSALQRLKTSAS